MGVQATLVSLLEMAYGSRTSALGALERALAVNGSDALPDAVGDVLAFVLGPLFSVLSAEIGPRLTKALVEDFTARFEPHEDLELPRRGSSAPPHSMPRAVARVSLRSRSTPPAPADRRALLADVDRVGRANLARALMRARWGVSVVDSVEDLGDALGEAPLPDAFIVDVHHPAAEAMIRALASGAPGACIVVRGPDGARAQALRAVCAEVGAGRVEIRAREAPAEELIDAVRRPTDV